MKNRHAAVLGLVMLAGGTVASGYSFIGPKWGVQQVPYYINPINVDMSQAEAIAAIQAGAAAWTMQTAADVVPSYVGVTSGASITMNGRNEIFFRNSSNGSLYGETYWWHDGNGRMLEADIIFHAATVRFFKDGTVCAGTGVYLQDALTHEFGHVLGIAHSSVVAATMYPTMTWCSADKRSLDSDDIAGVQALYPAGALNTPPTVTISSPSNGSSFVEGTSVGFTGSAGDSEDGNISNFVTWISSRDGQMGSGPNLQRVLTVGSHTITARVTDSKGAIAEAQRSVTITATPTPPPPPAPSSIALTATGYKVKGQQKADLVWSGAAAQSVDVYRNSVKVATAPNTGKYADPINRNGGGTYTFVICEAGTSTCSNQAKVTF